MSEESAPPQGDDLSGLSGFFFYVFIVHPATAWILRPGRFERKKSIMYAISFLALLAAVKTGTSCLLCAYSAVDIVILTLLTSCAHHTFLPIKHHNPLHITINNT